ncbi:MAG TPA: hypothetical protein VNU96_13385 [Burkholderiales bacterium]|nr:hypothetical protein [Burkholderiales bacterium]
MIQRIAAAAAALFAALCACGALACSCTDISRASPARLADFVARAERVVHARVAERLSLRQARIEVIESFKGAGEQLEALRGNEANCGFTFSPGEERVYFVFGGVVNLCGRAAPEPELLARLRSLKVDTAGCEGIVHPPRPPALAAVEEADPSPYEPLYGYDPDLALGVGHVRPVREEERDDWPRRLKLPVFTAPGGEVKIWLTPGSVGGDVLVETGYETASFIVLQARPDGWLQIRFGGPLASGAGWVHRCHLDAATPRLEYQPWEKLLAGAVPLYFRDQSARVLRKAPSNDAPAIANIPADPNLYGIQPLLFRGDWARVRVSVPSTYCADPKPTRFKSYEGWVRWRGTRLGPALWYYTRGC